MRNALTFDLEDYFHVTAFRHCSEASDWGSRESRLQRNTERILELLSTTGCQATFFVLGWVAEKYPRLVSRIAKCGHEIACHSHEHRLVYEMTPQEFREDTRRAKALLEGLSGQTVEGYRAPSFSITKDSLWAFEVLAELDFTYDSSIFPIEHPNYGMPQSPRAPFLVQTRSGSLLEFPMPTLELAGRRSPLAGGAYLRLLPYAFTRWGIRFINEQENLPVCVYVHPWELDPGQPRMGKTPSARLRHYLGLRGTERKLRRLLRDFEFCSLKSFVAQFQSTTQYSLTPNYKLQTHQPTAPRT